VIQQCFKARPQAVALQRKTSSAITHSPKANAPLESEGDVQINHPRHVMRLQPLLFQDGVGI